jgi:hypothetical protein
MALESRWSSKQSDGMGDGKDGGHSKQAILGKKEPRSI